MTHSKPVTVIASAAAIALSALALAACGGGGAATASPPPAPSKTANTHASTVRVAHTSLGSILVDSSGHTLYLFKADSATKSACSGACASAWPPLLTTGKPTAGAGVAAPKLTTIKRPGGTRQVTYNGHPLYLFVMDQRPGQTTGQGVVAFGAAWFALSATGNQISTQPTKHASGSSSSNAPKPAHKPAAKPAASPNNGIPQNNGGDQDSDNNGGPSDGDGNL